jgi:hypothetical protein
VGRGALPAGRRYSPAGRRYSTVQRRTAGGVREATGQQAQQPYSQGTAACVCVSCLCAQQPPTWLHPVPARCSATLAAGLRGGKRARGRMAYDECYSSTNRCHRSATNCYISLHICCPKAHTAAAWHTATVRLAVHPCCTPFLETQAQAALQGIGLMLISFSNMAAACSVAFPGRAFPQPQPAAHRGFEGPMRYQRYQRYRHPTRGLHR